MDQPMSANLRILTPNVVCAESVQGLHKLLLLVSQKLRQYDAPNASGFLTEALTAQSAIDNEALPDIFLKLSAKLSAWLLDNEPVAKGCRRNHSLTTWRLELLTLQGSYLQPSVSIPSDIGTCAVAMNQAKVAYHKEQWANTPLSALCEILSHLMPGPPFAGLDTAFTLVEALNEPSKYWEHVSKRIMRLLKHPDKLNLPLPSPSPLPREAPSRE